MYVTFTKHSQEQDKPENLWCDEAPLGFADGPNKYRYAGNDPVNFRDPSGLSQAGNPLSNLAGGFGGNFVSTVSNAFTNPGQTFFDIGQSLGQATNSPIGSAVSTGLSTLGTFSGLGGSVGTSTLSSSSNPFVFTRSSSNPNVFTSPVIPYSELEGTNLLSNLSTLGQGSASTALRASPLVTRSISNLAVSKARLDGILPVESGPGGIATRITNSGASSYIPVSTNQLGAQGFTPEGYTTLYVDVAGVQGQGIEYVPPSEVASRAFRNTEGVAISRLNAWQQRQFGSLRSTISNPLGSVVEVSPASRTPGFSDSNLYQLLRGGEQEGLIRGEIPASTIYGPTYGKTVAGLRGLGKGLLAVGVADTSVRIGNSIYDSYQAGSAAPFIKETASQSFKWGGALATAEAFAYVGGGIGGPLGAVAGGLVGGAVGGFTSNAFLSNEYWAIRDELVAEPIRQMRAAGHDIPDGFEYDRFFFGHPGGARP